MIIGIIGSRRRNTFEDYELVERAFIPFISTENSIVSGGCPQGGDRFAEIIAKKYNISIKIHLAEWNKYGKSAGFKRNIFIAQDADVLIACVALNRKGGTEDTINKYIKLNKDHLILC